MLNSSWVAAMEALVLVAVHKNTNTMIQEDNDNTDPLSNCLEAYSRKSSIASIIIREI